MRGQSRTSVSWFDPFLVVVCPSACVPDCLSVWTAGARAAATGLGTCPASACVGRAEMGKSRSSGGGRGCPRLCGAVCARGAVAGAHCAPLWTLARQGSASHSWPALHVTPRPGSLCCPGLQARPFCEAPPRPAVPRPQGSLPWGPDSRPWLFPGEEEELELAAVSCALEFNISSSSRAAPICCRRAALVFITALPDPAEPCRAGLGGRATLVGSVVPVLEGEDPDPQCPSASASACPHSPSEPAA